MHGNPARPEDEARGLVSRLFTMMLGPVPILGMPVSGMPVSGVFVPGMTILAMSIFAGLAFGMS